MDSNEYGIHAMFTLEAEWTFGTNSPILQGVWEGRTSEEVKTQVTLVVWKHLLLDQCASAPGFKVIIKLTSTLLNMKNTIKRNDVTFFWVSKI